VKRVGRVDKVVRTGLILVRIEGSKPPRIGWKLYTEDKRPAGIVVDIIGPVDKPFAVVKPLEGITMVEGEELYQTPPRPRRSRGRHGSPARRRGRRR